MDQVGRGVRARDRAAALDVDDGLRGATDGHLAADDPRPVHDQVGQRPLDVLDLEDGAVGEDELAVVGLLAAALGVERGAVEDDLDP